jgi:hypothetical protein
MATQNLFGDSFSPSAVLVQAAEAWMHLTDARDLGPAQVVREVSLLGFDKIALNLGNPLGAMLPAETRAQACGLLIGRTLLRFAEREGRIVALPGYKRACDVGAPDAKVWYSPFTRETYAEGPGEGVVQLGKGYVRTKVERAEFALDGFAFFPFQEGGELAEPAYFPPLGYGEQEEVCATLSCTRRGAEKVFNKLARLAKEAGLVDGRSFLATAVAWIEEVDELQKSGYETGLLAFHPAAIRWFWRPLQANQGGPFTRQLFQSRRSLKEALAAWKAAPGPQPQPQTPVQPVQPQPQPQPVAKAAPVDDLAAALAKAAPRPQVDELPWLDDEEEVAAPARPQPTRPQSRLGGLLARLDAGEDEADARLY